jgi:hypothetical protein
MLYPSHLVGNKIDFSNALLLVVYVITIIDHGPARGPKQRPDLMLQWKARFRNLLFEVLQIHFTVNRCRAHLRSQRAILPNQQRVLHMQNTTLRRVE